MYLGARFIITPRYEIGLLTDNLFDKGDLMKLIFSGIVIPISTIDWYGRSVSVIFFNGCNFKCLYAPTTTL